MNIALFLLFILAIANTYLPFLTKSAPYLVGFAKARLSLTLFLKGSSLSFKTFKSVGISPLVQGTVLWILISIASLCAAMVLKLR